MATLYQRAEQRLAKLGLSTDLLEDPSGQTSAEEHLTWLINATSEEIFNWVAQMQTTVEDEIIDCDGEYEVHPVNDGCWEVVNGKTGVVHCVQSSRDEAVAIAEDLNRD